MPAESKAQRRFMGAVMAAKEGKIKPKGKLAQAAKSMTKKEVKKFAKTKEAGLPERVKEDMNSKENVKNLINDIINKDYVKAKQNLNSAVENKIKEKIAKFSKK